MLVVLCVLLPLWFDLPAHLDQLCPLYKLLFTAYAHVRTEPQSDIAKLEEKKQLKSGFACAGLFCSNSDAGCSNKRSSNFLFVALVGLCCGFCDFAVSFLVPPDGPKMGRESAFFCSFTKLCMWSPCLGSFFKVFCIRFAEAQCFGFNETLRLMATGQLGRPF